MRTWNSGKLSVIGALVLIMSLIMSTATPVFADVVKDGSGGESFAGAGTNTFVRTMDLQEVYLDIGKNTGAGNAQFLDGSANNVTINNATVTLDGSKVNGTGTTTFGSDSWKYVYQNAAIFPNGTKGNVELIYTLISVTAYTDGNKATFPGRIWLLENGRQATSRIDNVGATVTGKMAFKAYMKLEVKVTGGNGTFIVPYTGINQLKGTSGAWAPFADHNLTEVWRAESFNFYDKTTQNDRTFYIPTQTALKQDSTGDAATKDYYPTQNTENDSYNGGFAFEGGSGNYVIIGQTGAKNEQGGTQKNDSYIRLGDLQHRIWSGSGPHGSIETYKDGKTKDSGSLGGGEFTGEIPFGKPAENTDTQQLMRYVVPDAKDGVTYTMTPKKGYTLEKVVVDGNTYTVPDKPEATTTIASTDGDGTLKYLGGGEFTYSFDNPNTQDHEIYVTWKKVQADIQVDKVWKDNSKAPSDAKVKLTWGSNSEEKAVPTSDGNVHKWENMYVFEYDNDGVAGDAITYKLEETPDPVSDDYVTAVWSGTDKAGASVDAGFTLEDSTKDNGAREKDDVLKATVTNIIKKDVAITKKWADQSNKYNTRPSDVAGMFKLYNEADDTEVTGVTPTATASGDNAHTVKWSGLPAFDTDGNEITYYAKETVPTGYTSDPSNGKVAENGTITNTLETVDVEITKKWDDADDKDKRPGSTKDMFELYTDATATTKMTNPPEPTESGSDTVIVKWSGVPKYDSSGTEISYSAKETVPDGYKADPQDGIVANGGTITNTYLKPPTGQDATSRNEKGVTQTGKPEFTPGTGGIPSTGAYTLLDKKGDPQTSITVVGQGTYTIDPDTGIVTFVPDPDFVGKADGVTVQVTDEDGLTATAKYTPTVVDNERTKKITRTIKYTYLTKDGKTAHEEVVQTLRAVQKGHYDPTDPNADENGMVWDDDWSYPDGKTFPAVKNPNIKGWKTSDVAGEYTITGPDDVPPTVHIVYQKSDDPGTKDKDSKGEKSSGGTRTGDRAMPYLFGAIMLLAVIVIAITLIRRRRNQ